MKNQRPSGVLSVLLLTGLLGVSSCSDDGPAEPEAPTLTGTFTLVAANGEAVPADVVHDGMAMRIVSGSMTFRADGTCVSRMVFIPPGGAETTREVSATYTVSGDRVTIRWEGAGTTVGILDGERFTMDNAGLILAYSR